VSSEFSAPELIVVLLIPLDISGLFKDCKDFDGMMKKMKRNTDAVEQHYIPVEVGEKSKGYEDLRIFYESDIEYFDESYLKLKRFCRIDLRDITLTLLGEEGSQKTFQVKPYLTIFDVGMESTPFGFMA